MEEDHRLHIIYKKDVGVDAHIDPNTINKQQYLKGKNMKLKRVLSGIIGLPIVVLILVFGNLYLIDAIFTVVAFIAMHEYLKAFSNEAKPVKLIAYISCLIIPFLHIINKEYLGLTLALTISSIIVLLFFKVIRSKMKVKISDIMITFFGICYIVFFLCFIPLLHGEENGKYLIWYIFIAAWGTDTCAYFVGSKFGKHKFTEISPKKSIEGCIRWDAWCCNNCYNLYIMY